MGAHVSCSRSEFEGDGVCSRPKMGDIPEGCVALVLMQLDPPEICRLARLNRVFRSASFSDFIWESKLPSNYRVIAAKVFDEDTLANLEKRDLYARLSRPIPFDGGSKELWIDKNTGGLCLSISSKALKITGIDDRRYWARISTNESRFQSVAYLKQTWWLEVNGEIEFQFPPGTYSLFFRVHLGRSLKKRGRRYSNLDHIHGWDVKPVKFQIRTSDNQHAVSHFYLDNRPGKWAQYHVGDSVVQTPNRSTAVKFSMEQIDCTHTKGGLCIDAVFVLPVGVGEKVATPDRFCT